MIATRSSNRQINILKQRINATAQKCDGQPRRQTRSAIPEANRCANCRIGIYRSQAEAGKRPFFPTVNLRVGNLCIGCAGTDSLPMEAVAELVPAAPPTPEIPPAALLAAHEEYWQGGQRLAVIAKRHGFSHYAVLKLFRRYGLKTRNRKQAQRHRRELQKKAKKEAAVASSDLKTTQ